jgi:hypothetical protein
MFSAKHQSENAQQENQDQDENNVSRCHTEGRKNRESCYGEGGSSARQS